MMKITKVNRWLLGPILFSSLLLNACPATGNPPACDQSKDYALAEGEHWVNTFESESIDFATDANGVGVGFVTWDDGSSNIKLSKEAAKACSELALPQQKADNQVLKIAHKVTSWGGFTHAFSNEALDTWQSQDWSSYQGISFWFKGSNSGKEIQVEVFDNRQIGNPADSAERYFYRFKDDTSDWHEVNMAFSELQRRSDWQPGGAPDDGLGLKEVWGYAFSFPSGEGIAYLDNVKLYGKLSDEKLIQNFEASVDQATDVYDNGVGLVTWQDGQGDIELSKVTATGDLAIDGQDQSNHVLGIKHHVAVWGGFTHAFSNEALDTWLSQDWSSYQGISFWFKGPNKGNEIQFELFDNRQVGSTNDTAERYFYRFKDDTSDWRKISIPFSAFQRRADWQPGGAPNDGLGLEQVWGYAFSFPVGEGMSYLDEVKLYGYSQTSSAVKVGFESASLRVEEGSSRQINVLLDRPATAAVTVDYHIEGSSAMAERDYQNTSGKLSFEPGETQKSFTLESLDDSKYEGNESLKLILSQAQGAELGFLSQATLVIEDNDTLNAGLLEDFDSTPYYFMPEGASLNSLEVARADALARPNQDAFENILKVDITSENANFGPRFAQAQDWSAYKSFSFWFYGQNTGKSHQVRLYDNAQPDAGPSSWQLRWSEEFDELTGTYPNSRFWTPEIGDGVAAGNQGWGNAERQYYTDSPENAATDGEGNLVITAKALANDSGMECYYGPCEYTSARLISKDKFEFAYGRVEARLKVPFGQGIWPAFWLLGEDIAEVGWPQSGEIDIMENIGKEPSIAHGTIHGPGYSGGAGIGAPYELSNARFADDFHVFTIEWEPDVIRWYVDGNLYNTLTKADIPANSEWVFNHPFFILFNVAVGGYWPGYPDNTTTFPQQMTIDYVRLYQAPDTAERFEASFKDDFNGWQKVMLPFSNFSRSSEQMPQTPNDGLGLKEVWGYGFEALNSQGTWYLDGVGLEP